MCFFFHPSHTPILESQFLRAGGNAFGHVSCVEVLYNPKLVSKYNNKQLKFQRERKNVDEFFVFHGTRQENIDLILRDGFKVGGQDGVVVAHGAALGPGVYTAKTVGTPSHYAQGSNRLLLSVGFRGAQCDHVERGDVIVFKSKEQILPLYVVHY